MKDPNKGFFSDTPSSHRNRGYSYIQTNEFLNSEQLLADKNKFANTTTTSTSWYTYLGYGVAFVVVVGGGYLIYSNFDYLNDLFISYFYNATNGTHPGPGGGGIGGPRGGINPSDTTPGAGEVGRFVHNTTDPITITNNRAVEVITDRGRDTDSVLRRGAKRFFERDRLGESTPEVSPIQLNKPVDLPSVNGDSNSLGLEAANGVAEEAANSVASTSNNS